MSETTTSNVSYVSIGSCELLGVLFVGLKLTHYIDWSWWWVTLPFWGWIAVFLSICLVMLSIVGGTIVVGHFSSASRTARRMRR